MSSPKPSATGRLEVTPPLHLLVYMLDRRLSGSLVLEEPSGNKHAIYFDSGAPAKVRTAQGSHRLGDVLRDLGLVASDAIERAAQNSGKSEGEPAWLGQPLLGQMLLRQGAVSESGLAEALREQVARRVLTLFSAPPETVYGYYDEVNFLERQGGEAARVNPLSLIWRGLRQFPDHDRARSMVARLGAKPLSLQFDAPVGRLKLAPKERAIVDLLRAKPMPYSVLLASGVGDESTVRWVVYGLALTRQLDFGIPGVEPLGVDEAPSSRNPSIVPGAASQRGESQRSRHSVPHGEWHKVPPKERPSRAPATPPPASPGSGPESVAPDSPSVREFKQEILEISQRHGQNYYEILGVPAQASTATIQAAFFQLAKKWHPDRLGPEYADVRDLATRIFARMSEAHQILSDEKQRAEYDALLQQGAGSAEEQERVAQVLRAATAFQKAEVLLKKHSLAAAEVEARKALEQDPDQADYLALLAWIQAQQAGRENFRDLIEMLDRALALEPENIRARWYRGQLLKRAGESARAVRDFRHIVEKDPKHLEAQRELRLHEMRRSNPEPPAEKPNTLLGKFFKR